MTAKHKGGLVVILGLGFIITLPLLLFSTPDEKQRLTQSTTTMRILEQHVGLLDVTPDERSALKSLLSKEVKALSNQPERDAWVKQVAPKIMQYEKNEQNAKVIARWVWVYAQRHELDPNLILALITIESQFDPFAISSVGAQGLMQIMPFWKKELGNESDNLFDVATNIRYGCAILKHYFKRYKTATKALAAYNGSKGKSKYPNKIFTVLTKFQNIK